MHGETVPTTATEKACCLEKGRSRTGPWFEVKGVLYVFNGALLIKNWARNSHSKVKGRSYRPKRIGGKAPVLEMKGAAPGPSTQEVQD